MQLKFQNLFMKFAEETAKVSSAQRLQVGAVIVKNNRVISIGYNGTPAGWDNVCEDADGNTKSEVMHAEENAILKLAKDGESGLGSWMFLTHAPCIHCARMIHGVGINTIVYGQKYKNDEGLEFLEKSNIPTFHFQQSQS